MRVTPFAIAAWSALASVSRVIAWDKEGHENVAIIADHNLTPSARLRVCQILHSNGDDCSLAANALWADEYENTPEGAWSASSHYVMPNDDYPPSQCSFGLTGWKHEANLLSAIVNQTQKLVEGEWVWGAAPLKFLIHLMGDLHQPLHLSGRDRLGTTTPVVFGDQRGSLHDMWDSVFVQRKMQDAASKAFVALTPSSGTFSEDTYDALIRLIEDDIGGVWSGEVAQWILCPGGNEGPQSPPSVTDTIQRPVVAQATGVVLACPIAWGQAVAQMNCDYVWTAGMSASPDTTPVQLNGSYWDRLERDRVITRLLAQDGLRLAAVLNAAFD